MPSPIAVTDYFGRQQVEPKVFAKTDLQQQAAVALSALNDVVVLGQFPTGKPDTIQTFLTPEAFRAVHDAGNNNDVAVQLVRRAATPFKEPGIGGAARFLSDQVGNQTVATRVWQTGGATTKITLTSAIYGLPANKFESKFSAGTVSNTKKLEVRKNGDPGTLVSRDNLGLAFTIRYTGVAGAATMTVTVTSDAATKVELLESAVVKFTFNADDAQYKTVAQLAQAIDDLTDYTCSLASGVDPLMPITYLDAVAAQDIKTADFTEAAALGSIVWYVNQNLSAYYTAVRATGQTVFGDNDTDFVFATGGTNPTVVLQDWRDALTILDNADLPGGFLLPVTIDAAVQGVITDFIVDQAARKSKTWRTVFATAAGATATQIKSLAFGQNHTRVMVVGQRIKDFDDTGALVSFDPLHAAAIMVGGSAGTPTTTPLTMKRMNVQDLADSFDPATREDLMLNGVTVFRKEPSFGIVVAYALSTALDNKRMPRIWQDSIAADVLHNSVFQQFKTFPGTWASLELKAAAEVLVIQVMELAKAAGIISDGVNAAGTQLRAYEPPVAKISAGLMSVSWKAYIPGEVDFIGLRGDVEYQDFGVAVTL